MTHTAHSKHHQETGYRRLIGIKCDCGQPATHQAQVWQFNSNGVRYRAVLPLCQNCYNLILQEDRGVVRAW